MLRLSNKVNHEIQENIENWSVWLLSVSPSVILPVCVFLQVPESPGPCCRRTLPRSLSIEHLSELNQLLEGDRGRGGLAEVRRISPSCLESEEGDSSNGGGRRVCGSTHRPPGEHECEFCDTSCYSTSCYSTSCYSTSCYSNSGYEARGHVCSHTRLSSVDSNRLSGSTVFSSQEEDEDEESAFESVSDIVQSEGPDRGGAGGERRPGRWKETRRGEQGEPVVPGASDKNSIGEMKYLLPPVGCLTVSKVTFYVSTESQEVYTC